MFLQNKENLFSPSNSEEAHRRSTLCCPANAGLL